MLNAALAWHEAGCSIIRTTIDGTKAPLGKWDQYKTERASRETLTAWFKDGYPGMGLVCGAISGNLEMLEFEGTAADLITPFLTRIAQQSPSVAQRIMSYVETSPSGGIHFFYRVTEPIPGNTKLAYRPNPHDLSKRVISIETRGEGGQVVIAPSHFQVHDYKDSRWAIFSGTIENIPTFNADEHELIHSVARTFDESPQRNEEFTLADRGDTAKEGDPGYDFNQRGTWEEVLEPAGYAKWYGQSNGGQQWTRPGKRIGCSLVTGGSDLDLCWVYSTSCEGLDSETAYSKWRVYAFLHCAGDFKRAASELRHKGYGAIEHTLNNFTLMPIGGKSAEEVAPKPLSYVTTEDSMAQVLVDHYGSHIRYSPTRGRWYIWNDIQWEPSPDDSGGRVREFVKDISRQLLEDDFKWAKHCLSANGVSNIVRQARTDARVVVHTDDLDSNRFELNTPTGIVDLRTGEIQPHNPASLHTKITKVSPDYSSTVYDNMKPWQEFLRETFAGNEDVIEYIQKLVGYSATGLVREHVLPFCYGGGGNGKGVFLETVQKLLGDYGTTSPPGFLMSQQFQSHTTEIARLTGARMVLCSEVNKHDKFDEAKVKQLTGGDSLTARFMRQDDFTFEPTHKLWLMGNDYPEVESGGRSFWRRVKLIPFLNDVPDEKIDTTLGERFVDQHGAAILTWIIQGAVAYFRDGLRPEPESVVLATKEYAEESDTFKMWFEREIVVTGTGETRCSDVRANYEVWCKLERKDPLSSIAFGKRMTREKVERDRSSSDRVYMGIMLKKELEKRDQQNEYQSKMWND